MKIYKPMSVADLLGWLDEHKGEAVVGLGYELMSYRGYYEHLSIEPDPFAVRKAEDIAKQIRDNLGNTFIGYKGGDYVLTTEKMVFVADYSNTGPALVGFDYDSKENVWNPVGCVEGWF